MLAYILNTGLELIALNIEEGQRARFEERKAGAFREFTSEEYNSVGVDNLQYVSAKTVEITGTTLENATMVFTDPFSILSLEEKCRSAEDIAKRNYKTFKQGGITYTSNAVDYNIEYTDETIQNVFAKTAILNGTPPSTVLSWTMDTPRKKITFLTAEDTQAFLPSLANLIEVNHGLYLDKITGIKGFTSEEVNAFINDPSYPVYTNIIL